jgi:hypothetical protein
MSRHECLAANTLNSPKRLACYESQDSLAAWPVAGQVVPPDVVDFADPDAASDADLLISLRYDMSSDLVVRFRRSTMLTADPGELQIRTGENQRRFATYFP